MAVEVLRDRARNIQGRFDKQPDFLLLHGTRGEKASRREEFDSNRRYCVTNGLGLAWHVTVGENAYSVHMPATEWGYHAFEASKRSIGMEFAQPDGSWGISDAQVEAAAHYLLAEVAPVWPKMNLAIQGGMRHHSEIPEGKRVGKTDVYPNGDVRCDQLRERIIEALGGRGKALTGGNGDGDVTVDLTVRQENKLFDAFIRDLNAREKAMLGAPIWRGYVFGRKHWSGAETTPALRTERGLLIIAGGTVVVNATGMALDDLQEHSRLRYRTL